jgi:hypothetical protein
MVLDDKKIEEAARRNADKYRNYPTLSDEDRDKVSIGSFMDCVKWMQEEFLKNLWHPASEEPDKHRICLVRVVYHLNYGMLSDEERIEQSSFHDFGWYDYDFKYIGVDYDIVSYLYVDELLPKKGGNHD